MQTENVNDLRKLRDTVSASLAALRNLNRPVDSWDDMLVYHISQKFSPRTRNEWNQKRASIAELPSYKDINEFFASVDYPIFPMCQKMLVVSKAKSRVL